MSDINKGAVGELIGRIGCGFAIAAIAAIAALVLSLCFSDCERKNRLEVSSSAFDSQAISTIVLLEK